MLQKVCRIVIFLHLQGEESIIISLIPRLSQDLNIWHSVPFHDRDVRSTNYFIENRPILRCVTPMNWHLSTRDLEMRCAQSSESRLPSKLWSTKIIPNLLVNFNALSEDWKLIQANHISWIYTYGQESKDVYANALSRLSYSGQTHDYGQESGWYSQKVTNFKLGLTLECLSTV